MNEKRYEIGKTKMNEKRIVYLDALKGFCIILVVFCHHVVLSNETIIGNIFMTFAWAAVPCFFMVTGGIFHSAKHFTWKKHSKRLWKVYITLVIWKFMYFCFYMLLQEINTHPLEIVKYLFFMGEIPNVDTGPMWFIYAYLQALSIYPITYYLHSDKENGKKIVVYMCVLLWMTSILPTIAAFFQITLFDSIFGLVPFSGYKSMLGYFLFGSFLFDNREQIVSFFINKKWICYFMIIVGIGGNLYIKYSYTGSLSWRGIYLENGYNRFSTMIMAVGLYLIFSMDIFPTINKYLSCLGKHTMGIFYLHYIILILYKRVCILAIENYTEYYSFGLQVIQTSIVIVLCTLLTVIAKKIPIIKNAFY